MGKEMSNDHMSGILYWNQSEMLKNIHILIDKGISIVSS